MPEDEIPVEERYRRQAKAAVDAARAALGPTYSGAETIAKWEVTGRIAVALILSDRKGD